MRRTLVAVALVTAAFGVLAQPYAPQEFDFSGPGQRVRVTLTTTGPLIAAQ